MACRVIDPTGSVTRSGFRGSVLEREASMKSRGCMLGMFALVVGLAACGAFNNDNPQVQDAAGSGSDATTPPATFTSFVIDQIKNHSADTTPVPYASFKDLPDPDTNNPNAY